MTYNCSEGVADVKSGVVVVVPIAIVAAADDIEAVSPLGLAITGAFRQDASENGDGLGDDLPPCGVASLAVIALFAAVAGAVVGDDGDDEGEFDGGEGDVERQLSLLLARRRCFGPLSSSDGEDRLLLLPHLAG